MDIATGSATGSMIGNAGGLNGTTGLYSTNGGFDKRALANTLLQAGSATAGGFASFGSAASMTGGGAIAGTVIGALAQGLKGGLNAYDAQKAMAALKECALDAKRLHDAELEEKIGWLMQKQQRKFSKGAADASLVAQPGVMLYRAGRAIYKGAKGTKGVNREAAASWFVDAAKAGGQRGMIANKVIQAVVNMEYEKLAKTALADAFKSG
jgi:hypothetical protein